MLQTLEIEPDMSRNKSGRRLLDWHHSKSVDSWLRDHFPDVDSDSQNCMKVENSIAAKAMEYHQYAHLSNYSNLQKKICQITNLEAF